MIYLWNQWNVEDTPYKRAKHHDDERNVVSKEKIIRYNVSHLITVKMMQSSII